jgi:hypothetical protein
MNIWRRGSLTENPYYRTAFQVARVPPEVVQHRTLVSMIGQTRRLIHGDPRAHVIQGEPVTDAAVNVAEGVLLDARQRIVEELLEHATEEPPLDGVRRLAQEVGARLAGTQTGPLPVTNPAGLYRLADCLVGQFAAAAIGQASLGTLELELVPPFGPPQED